MNYNILNQSNTVVEIDYKLLAPEVLENILKEVALKEGTDYGETVFTLDEKVFQLQNALHSGHAKLVYDSQNNHIDIIPK